MTAFWICAVGYAGVCLGFCIGYIACALLASDRQALPHQHHVNGE